MKFPPAGSNSKRRIGRITNTQNNQGSIKQKSNKNQENENVCAACLFQISIFGQDYCGTQCGHHYHQKCLQQWLKQKNTCCLCRQKIKKYTSKIKGQVTVPERQQRNLIFDLIRRSDSQDWLETFLFGGNINSREWVVITSNIEPSLNTSFLISFNDIQQNDQPMTPILVPRQSGPLLEPIQNQIASDVIQFQLPQSNNRERQQNQSQLHNTRPTRQNSRPRKIRRKPAQNKYKKTEATKRLTRSQTRNILNGINKQKKTRNKKIIKNGNTR